MQIQIQGFVVVLTFPSDSLWYRENVAICIPSKEVARETVKQWLNKNNLSFEDCEMQILPIVKA